MNSSVIIPTCHENDPRTHLQELVRSATEVFIASRGYHRTQMADVARAVGVSTGTL